ncbi:MAG TPA: SUMF1/EgtB/PvdO family nonheme iron enzyme [Kofleriaceae bacterium]
MDAVQRCVTAFVSLATCWVIGCGGKKTASVVDVDAVHAWAKEHGCVTGNANASDVLADAQFSCIESLGECGCRAVISARSRNGGPHADTVQLVVANCRHIVGARAADHILMDLLGSLVGMGLEHPLHEGDLSAPATDAPATAMSVTEHLHDTAHSDWETTVDWSRDVFADGKPQRTETYKIVVSSPPTAGDHKMTWSETPTVTTAPVCTSHAPADEDMASIPAGPPIDVVTLRCPPRTSDATVPAFEIDRHPVTCDEYAKCVDAHACVDEPDDCLASAVVSRASATSYCKWRHARLPMLREWQRAVRGSAANRYPTGSTWDAAAGCRVQTIKIGVAGLVRCENTSADGVTYYVLDPHDEWTGDDDCVLPKDPAQRQPVGMILGLTLLDRASPRPETDHDEFRCARSGETK